MFSKAQLGRVLAFVPVTFFIFVILAIFVALSFGTSLTKVGLGDEEAREVSFHLASSKVLAELFVTDSISYNLNKLEDEGIKTEIFEGSEKLRDLIGKAIKVDRASVGFTGEPYLNAEQTRELFLPIEEKFVEKYGCNGENELKVGFFEGNQFRYYIDYPSYRISEGFGGRYELEQDFGKLKDYYSKDILFEGESIGRILVKMNKRCWINE